MTGKVNMCPCIHHTHVTYIKSPRGYAVKCFWRIHQIDCPVYSSFRNDFYCSIALSKACSQLRFFLSVCWYSLTVDIFKNNKCVKVCYVIYYYLKKNFVVSHLNKCGITYYNKQLIVFVQFVSVILKIEIKQFHYLHYIETM